MSSHTNFGTQPKSSKISSSKNGMFQNISRSKINVITVLVLDENNINMCQNDH